MLCVYSVFGDLQYPQLINNKKTRALPGSERRFAPVLAILCRPTLRRFAPSLRAPFSFCVVPVVARLRRSTTGYCLSPLTGLQFRLVNARNHPFNFRFIGLIPFTLWGGAQRARNLRLSSLRVRGTMVGLPSGVQ